MDSFTLNNFLYLFHYILYIYFCVISTRISLLILGNANMLVLIYLLFYAFFHFLALRMTSLML
jgi:hypothetical protein